MKRRIALQEVGPGMFASERFVSFTAGGKAYSLFVDAGSVHDKTLEVQLVAEDAQGALVELPSDTFDAGSRVRVPRELLLPAAGAP